MKNMVLAGVILIVLGVVALVWEGISYTRREEVVRVGPFQAEVETRERISVPPWLAGIAVGAGIALVVVGRKKQA